MALNAQYTVAVPNSLPVRLAGYQRRRMFARFLSECAPGPTDTIVDVGVTSDQTCPTALAARTAAPPGSECADALRLLEANRRTAIFAFNASRLGLPSGWPALLWCGALGIALGWTLWWLRALTPPQSVVARTWAGP